MIAVAVESAGRSSTNADKAWSGDAARTGGGHRRPDALAQVVLNLLNNAAKYTDEGGRIRLSVAVEKNQAVIRVRDNGTGIAPEMLPRIFDLFTQVDRTLDRSQGGLGLGLTLVRRLTEMHGGSVEADTAPGLAKGASL